MGIASSADNSVLEVLSPEPGPSLGQETETFLDQLKRLPHLAPVLRFESEPVWEDLRRFNAVHTNPDRLQLKQNLIQVWQCLRQWNESNAQKVHNQQTKIHALLDETAEQALAMKTAMEEERRDCVELHAQLTALASMKEKASALLQQLEDFKQRLYRLK